MQYRPNLEISLFGFEPIATTREICQNFLFGMDNHRSLFLASIKKWVPNLFSLLLLILSPIDHGEFSQARI